MAKKKALVALIAGGADAAVRDGRVPSAVLAEKLAMGAADAETLMGAVCDRVLLREPAQ